LLCILKAQVHYSLFYKKANVILKDNTLYTYNRMEQLNIVELIESNPITKLTNTYNVKLLNKIKEKFTDFEQQLFISSFYCYLNYDKSKDFVIDLDNVWKWLGFSTKQHATRLLEKHFMIEIDYKISAFSSEKAVLEENLLTLEDKQKKGSGGHNVKKIMLNIKCFKSLCLKSQTKKASEIHEYYMNMEEVLQETIEEEGSELKQQLIQQNKELEDNKKVLESVEKDKEKLKEDTLIEQFPLNTQCIYIGKIDNKTLGKPNSKMYQETLIKFGQSNNLSERVKCHKKTYNNFRLYTAFKVKNKIEIENAIKKHPILQKRIRLVEIEDIVHRELLALNNDEFTIEKVEEYIKEIIKQNEYNIENYNLLLKKSETQEEEISLLKTELERKEKKISEITLKLNNYTGEGDITVETKNKISSNFALCKYGYYLYIYQYENMRFICSITRQKDFEALTNNLNNLYSNGEMKYKTVVSYPFSEKNMMFILKQHCVLLGNNKFEGSFENIKKIIDITQNLENIMINNSKDLDKMSNILNNTTKSELKCNKIINSDVPIVRKAKRSIDQINKETGEIIKTYESIEAAGRSLNLTTGTAVGIALRENRVCQGFLWRYSGISKEEQYNEQPVIKVCCSTGKKTFFKTIADSARDVNISAPALRNRILTNVHINNHHWIFDKNATHYHS